VVTGKLCDIDPTRVSEALDAAEKRHHDVRIFVPDLRRAAGDTERNR